MMNTDKAYLYGLIIGGGVFGNNEDTFRIELPYKKWGSFSDNASRVEEIQNDIMRYLSPLFRTIYGLSISYQSSRGGWWILCEGDTSSLIADLSKYGIECTGNLRTIVSLGKIITELVDDNLKRRFIAGFADTIGSLAKSQRRFTDEKQIISFEIKGFNYPFVCDLCRLLHSLNCFPDQVNWNHPNIHCGSDSYDDGWRKGFKVRVLLDQYATEGSFAFKAKALASIANRKLQQQTNKAKPCPSQRMLSSAKCVHPAENSSLLPEMIRGGHYLHYRHFCAVLGCEHAPYDKICMSFSRVGELVSPFPIQCRSSLTQIDAIISDNELLSMRNYSISNEKVSELMSLFRTNPKARLFGINVNEGYPLAEVLKAIAFVIANSNEIRGKKTRGKYQELIMRHIEANPSLSVEMLRPDLLTPLVIVGNGRGVLVGAENPKVYEKLISRDPNNQYKLLVRQITVEDLINA